MFKKKEISSKKEEATFDEIRENFPEIMSLIEDRVLFRVFDDEKEYIASKDEILFFFFEGHLLPTLQLLRQIEVKKLVSFPKVKVDAGAVPHMINGADVFAPGITEYDAFTNGDIVLILNPAGQILCLGKAVVNNDELGNTGLAFKNIHHLTDDIFNNEYL